MQKKVDLQEWLRLFEQNEKSVFCCDFNARAWWGNDPANQQGEKFDEALVSSSRVCINDETVTIVAGQEGHTDSAIHLALVSPTLVAQSRRNILGHYSSYHFPCIILIEKHRTWEHVAKTHAIEYDTNGQGTVSKIIQNKAKPLV